jgi:streptogramin lyase
MIIDAGPGSAKIVGRGVTAVSELRFELVEDWEQLPERFVHADCSAVGVDSHDNVYLVTRNDTRLIVYDRSGVFVRSWGENLFTPRTHGVTVGPDDSVYVVDDGAHCVYKFTPDGELLLTIGTPGIPSETGYDGRLETVRGGPPFNRPTGVALAPNGDIFVSDGYGNCKVHRFSATGELLKSWGAPGSGPGEFRTPHGLTVDAAGTVIVADRENDRLQFFDADGELLQEWNGLQRPSNAAIGPDGRLYVSEMSWRVGDESPLHGVSTQDDPCRVSVFDPDGRLVARWGGDDIAAPGNFIAPHDIAVDSHGDVYVAEVTQTFGVAAGRVPAGSHTFQKFALTRRD